MKKRIILPALLIVTILGACQKKYKCQSYNSEIISESVSVTSFHKIDLDLEADVIYVQGNEQSVIIEGPQKLMEYISASVFQNTLIIDSKNHFCFTNKKTIKIYITTPDLSEVEIDGSGNFLISNNFITNDFSVNIDGSGDFYADSISAETFSTRISGSGEIYLSGIDTMSIQTIKISGSGNVNMLDLPSIATSITISGSGDCKVHAINELDVKISGSGDVRYIGDPSVNTDITGSGSVKPF